MLGSSGKRLDVPCRSRRWLVVDWTATSSQGGRDPSLHEKTSWSGVFDTVKRSLRPDCWNELLESQPMNAGTPLATPRLQQFDSAFRGVVRLGTSRLRARPTGTWRGARRAGFSGPASVGVLGRSGQFREPPIDSIEDKRLKKDFEVGQLAGSRARHGHP